MGRLLPVLSSVYHFVSVPARRLHTNTTPLVHFRWLIADDRLRKLMNCISEGTIRGRLSRLVTGSTGTSVSTRSSVSTTCSDSGDDDSAGITTTGLMCSDRADARRKLGGFCKKHNFNPCYFLNAFCLLWPRVSRFREGCVPKCLCFSYSGLNYINICHLNIEICSIKQRVKE